ncbi:uncharacterized protein ASPGLDRAFT_27916 [Aspergillus glaucus CBS 516.65]|uniref:Uncharacterized protein n=1 Tax=Aspergillus glaucus CBS 516.65 TaxID=1160497 RepID=A0A1L9VCB4_ASPGL|nr:hypothetical protein ASPGLDRAFT_27916 [Aspergillus glaucus CBS 516.65]OJJ81533.1 hypothetical protein ASPGLDRAFT_27916 [Aspergillus glaucus CBS 516.65]
MYALTTKLVLNSVTVLEANKMPRSLTDWSSNSGWVWDALADVSFDKRVGYTATFSVTPQTIWNMQESQRCLPEMTWIDMVCSQCRILPQALQCPQILLEDRGGNTQNDCETVWEACNGAIQVIQSSWERFFEARDAKPEINARPDYLKPNSRGKEFNLEAISSMPQIFASSYVVE